MRPFCFILIVAFIISFLVILIIVCTMKKRPTYVIMDDFIRINDYDLFGTCCDDGTGCPSVSISTYVNASKIDVACFGCSHYTNATITWTVNGTVVNSTRFQDHDYLNEMDGSFLSMNPLWLDFPKEGNYTVICNVSDFSGFQFELVNINSILNKYQEILDNVKSQ
ncbi:ORF-136 [Teiidae poxvirus 1]|nr:ORF-136 [Teiidae poxvirus 1]